MAERTWLLTGGSGQIGRAFQQLTLPKDISVLVPPRAMLDLANLPDMHRFIAQHKIEAIINCAAYTAVDQAESDQAMAQAINGEAPAILANAAAAAQIPIVHVSTDYVFAGHMLHRSYTEDDAADPQNVYGLTKLAGEQAIAASGARHIILRTAWVVSPFGNNFVKTMLRLGAERDALSIVSDQIGSPTSAVDIASALMKMTHKLASDPTAQQGVYHFVNDGEASWYEVADYVFERMQSERGKRPKLTAIATSEYPTAALRPANSRLNIGKIAREYQIQPRHWHKAVDDILDQLLEVAA